jgi:hypothetical protein
MKYFWICSLWWLGENWRDAVREIEEGKAFQGGEFSPP